MQYVIKFKPRYLSRAKDVFCDDLVDSHLFRSGSDARRALKLLPEAYQDMLEVIPIDQALEEIKCRQGKLADDYTEG